MKMGLYDIQTKTEPFMQDSCVKEGLRKSPTRKETQKRKKPLLSNASKNRTHKKKNGWKNTLQKAGKEATRRELAMRSV